MRIFIATGILATFMTTTTALAQVSPQEQSATVSTAGKAISVRTATASVLVTGIDKANRKLTLKDATGREFSVIAGPEVRNFEQINVKDSVTVEYFRSLSLALTKAEANAEISENVTAVRAREGDTPAGATAHTVRAVAEVIAVDPAASTITLKGPRGRVFELDVKNPDHFKVVNKGDRVQVEYTEAVALSVKPTPHK